MHPLRVEKLDLELQKGVAYAIEYTSDNYLSSDFITDFDGKSLLQILLHDRKMRSDFEGFAHKKQNIDTGVIITIIFPL